MKTKKCSHCKMFKNTSEFHKNKSRKDGYASTCIDCYNAQNFYKTFRCTNCDVEFIIKHRNIRTRKYFLCEQCTRKRVGYLNTKDGLTKLDNGYLRFKSSKKEKSNFVHRKIMEDFLGRPLTKGEIVHHIDGDKLNNNINNLWLTDNSSHTKAHDSLEKLGMQLYKQELIEFDKIIGQYKLKI